MTKKQSWIDTAPPRTPVDLQAYLALCDKHFDFVTECHAAACEIITADIIPATSNQTKITVFHSLITSPNTKYLCVCGELLSVEKMKPYEFVPFARVRNVLLCADCHADAVAIR